MTSTFEEQQKQGDRGERHVSISIDGERYRADEPVLTGAALKELGGIPSDYQLFLEVPGPDPDRGIRDDESVELRSGMKFYGVVSGTLGSAA